MKLFDISIFKDDLPLIFLISSNVLALILALVQGWNFATMLWLYWMQSIIIGAFTFLKLCTYKNTVMKSIDETPPGLGSIVGERVLSFFLGIFFLVHYGIFHVAYFFFLVMIGFMTKMPASDSIWIVFTGAAFLFAHAYSYHRNRERDQERNPLQIMSSAYSRIIPTHLIIIFGTPIYMASTTIGIPGGKTLVLVFFVLLKTIADVMMHVQTHRPLQVKN